MSKRKQATRNNALTACLALVPMEDSEAYRSHLAAFTGDLRPKGATEEQLVRALAGMSWRMNRMLAFETRILSGDGSLDARIKAVANLSLYSERLSRQFASAAARLAELQRPASPRPASTKSARSDGTV